MCLFLFLDMLLIVMIVGLLHGSEGQLSQLCNLSQGISRSNANKVIFCNNTCANKLECLQGICVNTSSMRIQIGRHSVKQPNNLYFTFSIWDKDCNPIVLDRSVLESEMKIYSRRLTDKAYTVQSIAESGNGVIPAGMDNFTSRIILLLDTSGSVIQSWNQTRAAAATFVQSLANRPNETAKFLVRIFTFDGRMNMRPLVVDSVEVTPTFVDVKTPRLSATISKSVITESDPGYDPSTNLYGAILQSAQILHEGLSQEDMNFTKNYLVTYTDGTDRANYVDFGTALSALTQYPPIHRYCVVEPGDIDPGDIAYAMEMQDLCASGMSFLSAPSAGCPLAVQLPEKFLEISTLITALVQNYGLFLHCPSFRAGVYSVQPRFGVGAPGQADNDAFTVDSAEFNTSRRVCTPSIAAAWTNGGGEIQFSEDDFAGSACKPSAALAAVQR